MFVSLSLLSLPVGFFVRIRGIRSASCDDAVGEANDLTFTVVDLLVDRRHTRIEGFAEGACTALEHFFSNHGTSSQRIRYFGVLLLIFLAFEIAQECL